VSKKNASSTKAHDEILPPDFAEQVKQREEIFGNVVEKLKPWLFEFGNWIFGGLLAFCLIVVGSILTVGPVNLAVLVSIATFACALPLNVSGLFLLKLIRDMNEVPFDDVMRQAFQDANIPNVEAYFPASEQKEALYKRRTNSGLRYLILLAALSATLTLFGMVAALWYMAWWVGVIFFLMVIASFFLVMNVLARWMPLETEAERELRQRYRDHRAQMTNKQRRNE
jgi:hypothetical protein